MQNQKTIALVAHDAKKPEMVEWVARHRDKLAQHKTLATGTTGKLIAENANLDVQRLQSGPLGGDQQIGALIAEGEVDVLIFFWDPLGQMPHDPDVKALLRLAAVWNIPTACNQSTADFIFASPLLETYEHQRPDYAQHINRKV